MPRYRLSNSAAADIAGIADYTIDRDSCDNFATVESIEEGTRRDRLEMIEMTQLAETKEDKLPSR